MVRRVIGVEKSILISFMFGQMRVYHAFSCALFDNFTPVSMSVWPSRLDFKLIVLCVWVQISHDVEISTFFFFMFIAFFEFLLVLDKFQKKNTFKRAIAQVLSIGNKRALPYYVTQFLQLFTPSPFLVTIHSICEDPLPPLVFA